MFGRFTDRTEDGHFFKWNERKEHWEIKVGEGERVFVIPPSDSEKAWKLRIFGDHPQELKFEGDDGEIHCFAFAAGFAHAEDPDEDDHDFDDSEGDELEDDWNVESPEDESDDEGLTKAGDRDLENDVNAIPEGPKLEQLPDENALEQEE